MGDIWLHAWPDYMAQRKVQFKLIDGWRTRARSTGGIDDLLGLWWHHTVSKTTPENDVNFCINISDDAPIGSGLLDRNGVFHYHTSGATNTNGRGGPWFTSLGIIPLDNGNRNGGAIEAANDGVGEVWPSVQKDAYIRLSASFIDMARGEFGLPMEVDSILAHHEWAPDRKTDPSGPPDPWGGPGRTLWRMDEVRSDLFRFMLPPPDPNPTPLKEDDMPIRACKTFTDSGEPHGPWFVGDGTTAHLIADDTEAAIYAVAGMVSVNKVGVRPELVHEWTTVPAISKGRARQYVGDHELLRD